MKTITKLLPALAVVLMLIGNIAYGQVVNSEFGEAHVHEADAQNTNGNTSDLELAAFQGLNNQFVFITPNWSPPAGQNIYNNHNLGVWYNTSTGGWSIFNQDLDSMPYGAAWNVLLADNENALMYTHTADTATNVFGNWTEIAHPGFDGDTNAMIFVTQNWEPGGGSFGTYNDHAIGVWYDPNTSKWNIFNQDVADMPHDASFNIFVPDPSPNVWVHTADTTNTFGGNSTYLDHDSLDGNPDAVIFVEQNWNPDGSFNGVYNDKAIGVWYDQFLSKWAIFNQSQDTMPLGAAFNVMIAVEKDTGTTAIDELRTAEFTSLSPNPANNSVVASYSLNQANDVLVGVYDMSGKQLVNLDRGFRAPGIHREEINLSTLQNGYYIFTIQAGDAIIRKPLVIVH